jgi:hypothetical protein
MTSHTSLANLVKVSDMEAPIKSKSTTEFESSEIFSSSRLSIYLNKANRLMITVRIIP